MRKTLDHNRALNPGWTFLYFDDVDARAFMQSRCNAKILSMYDDLLPGAFKADLFRLAALYEFGGVYMDMFFHLQTCFDTWLPVGAQMVVVQDQHCSNSVYNALLVSNARNPLWLRLLDRTVERCEALRDRNARATSQGRHDYFLYTGPVAMGQELNQLLQRSSFASYAPMNRRTYMDSSPHVIESSYGKMHIALHCKKQAPSVVLGTNGTLAITKFNRCDEERKQLNDTHYSVLMKNQRVFRSQSASKTGCEMKQSNRTRNATLTNFIRNSSLLKSNRPKRL